MNRRQTKEWEVSAFDREANEWTTTMNHAYEIDPEVPDFINQAAPTKITPTRRSKPHRADMLALFIPDTQIPFHDPKALQMAHVAVRELMPDRVVLLGDMVDLPAESSFETHPTHANLLQNQLDTTHQMLAQIRADAPNAEIDYIPGNHEKRLQKKIIEKNASLLNIKRADAAEELGVLTLSFLLRLEELEVSMAGAYPNGQVWLNDHTVAIHGDISSIRNSTSAKYLDRNPNVSVIHGHSHRAEIQWRTTETRHGYVQRFGMSPGTLADIEGSVPSHGSSLDEAGNVARHVENWQQAVGLVEYNDEMSNPELAMIQNGVLKLRGASFV